MRNIASSNVRNARGETQEAETLIIYLLDDLKSSAIRQDRQLGRRVHANAVESQSDSNTTVLAALIRMYGKCGRMSDARRVFDCIQHPNLASWNALLMGYAENGDESVTLDMFCTMKTRGCVPDSESCISALKACTTLAVRKDCSSNVDYMNIGRKIHSEIDRYGVVDPYVQSTLINMYAKLGCMVDARCVFDSIRDPNVVSWNVLILGYVENGKPLVALDLFSKMQEIKCLPSSVTYMAAIRACTFLALTGKRDECLKRGTVIHSQIGGLMNDNLQSGLIDMYSKCSCMVHARSVFDSIEKPDVVSWTALLMGYADNGHGLTTLELFARMKKFGCVPNSVTYVAALKACTEFAVNGEKSEGLRRVKEIHLEIGSHLNNCVQSTLIDMYAKCGSMVDARHVFDNIRKPDVVSWNVLLMGYTENGDGCVTLDLFNKMKVRGYTPDSVTYIAVIKACTSLAVSREGVDCLQQGRIIHLEIGCHLDHSVKNTLIDMYCKCGSMNEAHSVFSSIPEKTAVSWNVLLLGYAENGDGHATLDLFSRMKASGCVPDSITCVAVFKACSMLGALPLGRKFHLQINEFNGHVVTCLVDFYAKCGSMVEAHEVFDTHSASRNIATWNALLAGYASFDSGSVLTVFEAMQDAGFWPDSVTYVCMLLCCSHAGLVQEAREYFEKMSSHHGVTPTVMHYNCMVEVLGRANRLNETIAVLRSMACSPNGVTWKALLGASCKWKNVEIARLAFQSLVDTNNKDASVYVLMAHLYGSSGMWEEQQRVLVDYKRIRNVM